jgi:hypothetical protein
MKTSPPPTALQASGSSLLESVIAVGVMSVAIPLVFGAIAESGKSRIAAEAETRSTWVVPACLAEIHASREGKAQYFTTTTAGEAFPPGGEVWALGFSSAGKLIAKVDQAFYQKGIQELDGQAVRYLVALSAVPSPRNPTQPEMMRVKIALEFPAASPATRRQKLDFYTRIQ